MTFKLDEVQERIDEVHKLGFDMDAVTQSYFRTVSVLGLSSGEMRWSTSDRSLESRQNLISKYKEWYRAAYPLIEIYMPDAVDEFERLQEEFLGWIRLDVDPPKKDMSAAEEAVRIFHEQKALIEAIPERIKSDRVVGRGRVIEFVADREIDRAQQLLDVGHVRGAGIIAGVALENYLMSLCEHHELEFNYDSGISALGQTLYEEDVIPNRKLSQIQHLGDTRNDCAHSNSEDPTRSEVERLISQTRDLITDIE